MVKQKENEIDQKSCDHFTEDPLYMLPNLSGPFLWKINLLYPIKWGQKISVQIINTI